MMHFSKIGHLIKSPSGMRIPFIQTEGQSDELILYVSLKAWPISRVNPYLLLYLSIGLAGL